MFTLKLDQNAPAPSHRVAVMECAGIWITACEGGVKEIYVFKNKVGVADEGNDTTTFYVGGEPGPGMDAVTKGVGGNWYDWGVLENALGKTTEMIR
jgi:hypothetical protein